MASSLNVFARYATVTFGGGFRHLGFSTFGSTRVRVEAGCVHCAPTKAERRKRTAHVLSVALAIAKHQRVYPMRAVHSLMHRTLLK